MTLVMSASLPAWPHHLGVISFVTMYRSRERAACGWLLAGCGWRSSASCDPRQSGVCCVQLSVAWPPRDSDGRWRVSITPPSCARVRWSRPNVEMVGFASGGNLLASSRFSRSCIGAHAVLGIGLDAWRLSCRQAAMKGEGYQFPGRRRAAWLVPRPALWRPVRVVCP